MMPHPLVRALFEFAGDMNAVAWRPVRAISTTAGPQREEPHVLIASACDLFWPVPERLFERERRADVG